MDIRIEGGRALIGDRLESTTIHLASQQGVISHIGSDPPSAASASSKARLRRFAVWLRSRPIGVSVGGPIAKI